MDRPVFQSRRTRRSRYGSAYRSSRKASLLVATIIYLNLFLCAGVWVVLLTNGFLTIGGVPTPIIASFLQDETARNAYFQGDKEKLHARLQNMGIEDRIKAFYRPQIEDEAKLDQHIHQILYDRTGYVGQAYRVNQGVLMKKEQGVGSRE